jgi:lysophospholipase L1-like esterase
VRTFYEDIDIFRPEFLVIHFGIDDIYRPVYRSEFKENLVQLVRLARKSFDPKIFLLTSHTFDNSVAMDAANIFYKTIREVATDLNCILVMVHLWWMSYVDESGKKLQEFVQGDGSYPNEEGHKIFAKILLDKFRVKLKTE